MPIATEVPDLAAELPVAQEVPALLGPRRSHLPLLLEVGCEEIPARFLRDAETELGERVQAALVEARLMEPPVSSVIKDAANSESSPRRRRRAQPVFTYSTPRRLVVYAPKVRVEQPDKVEEILGPPVKVAVDAAGRYTRAAESFVQKNGARLEDLGRATTPKGEYLSLEKTTEGRAALEVLAEILPGTILGVSFPKSMYWTAKSAPRFVRPIRWVLALLGEGKNAATVDFEVLGVKSGNFTFGHRVKGSKPLTVTGFKNYSKKLLQSFVEIYPAKRLKTVVKESLALVENSEFNVLPDQWLADWIVNATEWPRPMLGNFDARFLHLPREILITVMRGHQRYFAVEYAGKGTGLPQTSAAPTAPEPSSGTSIDGPAKLAPHFVAVLNMDSDEKGLIRQGHERVLTARFRDAEFFWNADQKTRLRDRVPLLDRVTFQAELGNAGSYGDKVRRMRALAEYLCAVLAKPEAAAAAAEEGSLRQHVLRAVELSKGDLTTQMVQEFTELQGVVGGLYARAQGEPEEVATAVYDHYLPLGAEGAGPRSRVGAIVSLADKFDSIAGGFAVGYEPTGSSDPFALRRQANGIIKVLLEFKMAIGLKKAVNSALSLFDIDWREPRERVEARVLDFFAERLRFHFESVRVFRYDTVRAVIAAGADQPTDAEARAEAMEGLRGSEDFEALSVPAKRIRNILAKSATAADWEAGEVDRALLAEQEERDLNAAYATVAAEVQGRRAAHDYRRALEAISTLRPVVDRFFDKVLVMAEDRALRQNRLRLLKKLDELFTGIAAFAEIAEKQ